MREIAASVLVLLLALAFYYVYRWVGMEQGAAAALTAVLWTPLMLRVTA